MGAIAVFPPANAFSIIRMGCAFSYERCINDSLICTGIPLVYVQLCCCKTDYCNGDVDLTDTIFPKYSYRIDPPNDTIPIVDQSNSNSLTTYTTYMYT